MTAGAAMRARLVCALTLVPVSAAAQHAGHQHAPGGAPSEGHLKAQACLDEFDAVVRDGRGFGLAFAADQHGYPGPMHVLELAADALFLRQDVSSRRQRVQDVDRPPNVEPLSKPTRHRRSRVDVQPALFVPPS